MTTIGIDLGTTNSLVATWKDGEAILIPNVLGKTMTPSVVGFSDEGDLLIGEAAKERLISHPDKTIAQFKRYMGTNRECKIGRKPFRAEELSSFVLRALKEDAETFLGEAVTEAVISVPAYFSDAQRKATISAGKLAGLTVKRLVNEPTAAAIAYGLHNRDEESSFLVFDLGGGTFDVSILEIFDDVFEVHASAGDNHLGGEDFTDALTEYALQKSGVKWNKMGKEYEIIRKAANQCKLDLSTNESATMDFIFKKKSYQVTMTRKKLERIFAPLIDRIRAPIESAMRDAKIPLTELDRVVMVGGSSRIPAIKSLMSKMLGIFPTMLLNPDEVVALGTAGRAALLDSQSELKEIVLTDVCPHTLGTDVIATINGQDVGGQFHPIIERNCTVPVSKVSRLYTFSDQQAFISIPVYQGESRLSQDNILLGEIKVDIPAEEAGKEAVDIRYTYDANGILEVEATVVSTGLKRTSVIENNPGLLSSEEIQQRLKDLESIKIHPREKLENTTLIARGERIYEENLGDTRDYIGKLLAEFDLILDKQNNAEIKYAQEQLEIALTQFQ